MPRISRASASVLCVLLLGSTSALQAMERPAASRRADAALALGLGDLLMRHVRVLLGNAVAKNGASLDPFGQPKPGDSDPSGQRPAPAPPELPGE